jgi:hypothetical protein
MWCRVTPSHPISIMLMLIPKILVAEVKLRVMQSRLHHRPVDIDEVAKALAPQLPLFDFADIKRLVFECVIRTGADAQWH